MSADLTVPQGDGDRFSIMARLIVTEILSPPRAPPYKVWWLASLLRNLLETDMDEKWLFSGTRRANEQLAETVQELQARIGEMQVRIDELQREVDRLREGDLSEEEFQALCHKFQEDDALRFFRGCQEYQRKLFGYSSDDLREQHTRTPTQQGRDGNV